MFSVTVAVYKLRDSKGICIRLPALEILFNYLLKEERVIAERCEC